MKLIASYQQASILKKIFMILSSLAVIFALIVLSFVILFRVFSYLSKPKDLKAAKNAGQDLVKIKNETVMLVCAHPDDADWYAGGTLSLLHNNANKVVVVVATSGEKGGDAKNLGQIREGEQLEAAKYLGYDEVIFLRHKDRDLKANAKLILKIKSLIKKHKPSIVLTFDTKREGYIYRHPDHYAAGEATIKATKDTGISVYYFHSARNNVIVDIEAEQSKKIKALAAHKSQSNNRISRIFRYFPFRSRTFRNRGSTQSFEEIGIRYAELFRKD